MKIGIDFDDTIVDTKGTVRKFMNKYGVKEFKTEDEKTKFYRQHINEITKNLTLKDNVIEVLNRLKKDNELFLITARSDFYSIDVKPLTLKYIIDNNIPIDNIYFDAGLKFEKCLELNIDIFIDDLDINCELVNKSGIGTIIFQNECNGIKKADSWLEIEEVINLWKRES